MTNPDEEETLRAVAQIARAEGKALDPRLERLARGELSAGEEAALRSEAAQDPALARDLLMYTPFSNATRARFYEVAAQGRAPMIRPLRLLPLGGLALAAGLALFLMMPGPAELPPYQFSHRVEDHVYRDESGQGAGSVRLDSPIVLTFQPSQTVSEPVETRVYVLGSGAPLTAPVTPEISSDGGVRWQAKAGQFTGGKTGAFVLIAVVGRPGALPELGSTGLEEARGPGWQSASVRVLIRSVAAP